MPVSVLSIIHLHLLIHMLVAFVVIFITVVYGYRVLALIILILELHVFLPAHNSFQLSVTVGSPTVRIICIGSVPGIVIPVTVVQSIDLVRLGRR